MKNHLLIIYYHEIVREPRGFSYQKLTLDKFSAQMKYLSENGYRSLFFSELNESLPNKSIIVSFDDGFLSVYENAAPIMQKYGIKGNIYLPTAYIGTDPHFMSWNMVEDLYDSCLFEMQAHTHTHTDIRLLSEERLADEIELSDELFMKHLGYKPLAFCMPFGTWDRRSIGLVRRRMRYSFFLGSHYGRTSIDRLKNKVLPRIGISDDDTLEVFVKKLHGDFDWKGPLQLMRLHFQNIRGERVTDYDY